MTVRQATAADVRRLDRLDREFWAERQDMLPAAYRHTDAPTPPELIRARIAGDGFRTYVAEAKDR